MPKKILAIDDDHDMLDFCRLVLESAGYSVFTADNAKDGFVLAESAAPDLALLDIMMEDVDSGFRIATQLDRKKPILMLSAIAGGADQLFDTSSLPVSDLAQKPLSPDDLLREVERLLSMAE